MKYLLISVAIFFCGFCYAQETGVNAQDADTSESGEPTSESSEITVEDFFRSIEIYDATLSPDGNYVAYMQDYNLYVGNQALSYQKITRIGTIDRLHWIDNNSLVAKVVNRRSLEDNYLVYEIIEEEGKLSLGRKQVFYLHGYVMNTLPDEPEYILLGKFRKKGDQVIADIFRVNVYESIFDQVKRGRRLNKRIASAYYYVFDANDQAVIGLGYIDDVPQLYKYVAKKKNWVKIWSGKKDTRFIPKALSDDGQTLWALSNVTTDRMVAVAFDMNTATISEVLYQHDTVDVTNLYVSEDRNELSGVTYLQKGIATQEFFDESKSAALSTIKNLLPGQRVHIAEHSEDSSTFLVLSSSAQNPGSYHLCRPAIQSCSLVASMMSWLSGTQLSETLAFRTSSTDDFSVQSFLTLPVTSGQPVPLIVMPHGGPIGVRDHGYFSPDVQWLAYNGYAVLQVNYRGSRGFGKRFLSAGLRQWGRGIEDDIEAALDQALNSHAQLNRQRVCIYGASYGGYSALQSIIRSPDRYRCAASFAGVTDLTLMFNDSYVRKNEAIRDVLVEMIGDPLINHEELQAYSPVYNYEKITKPVFLAHGNEDNVVDVEHSWRLKKMLKLSGVKTEFHIFDRIGHGFDRTDEAKDFYDPLMKFLDANLK